jgi:hypothetical protein
MEEHTMASRKNGEKKHLHIFQGWQNAKGTVDTACAVWDKPDNRPWGEWRVSKTCSADMNDMVDLALVKHGKDPDAPGCNITTGALVPSWEK